MSARSWQGRGSQTILRFIFVKEMYSLFLKCGTQRGSRIGSLFIDLVNTDLRSLSSGVGPYVIKLSRRRNFRIRNGIWFWFWAKTRRVNPRTETWERQPEVSWRCTWKHGGLWKWSMQALKWFQIDIGLVWNMMFSRNLCLAAKYPITHCMQYRFICCENECKSKM